MKILMLQTRSGSDDGFSVQQYEQGQVYDVRDNLACAFIAAGHAEIADIPYVNLRWKSGNITRQPMCDMVRDFIKRGVAKILESDCV